MEVVLPTRRSCRYLAPGLAFTLLSCLDGGSEGQALSFDEAKSRFASKRGAIERALALLNDCRPRRPDNYNRVWVNEESGGGGPIHCTKGGDEQIARIVEALREAQLLSVDYSVAPAREAATGSVDWANFMLARNGISVSGSMTSIVYLRDGAPCARTVEGRPERGHDHLEKRPLTSSPCNWFWETQTT